MFQRAERATLTRMKRDGDIESYLDFQFNPDTLRRRVGASWQLTLAPGSTIPVPQFGAGVGQTLQVECRLNGREEADPLYVANRLAWLESLVMPDLPSTELTKFAAPPVCILGIGPRAWWCVVQSQAVTEQMYDKALRPMQATVALDLAMSYTTPGQEESVVGELQRRAAAAVGR